MAGRWFGQVGGGHFNAGSQFQQTAYCLPQGLVEIHQKGVGPFVEGQNVIGIIFEERAILVGACQCCAVAVAPVAVSADADVARGGARGGIVLYGDGERQRTVGSRNDAAVAVGLFHIVLAAFLPDAGGGIEFGIVVYGAQIGRSEQCGIHRIVRKKRCGRGNRLRFPFSGTGGIE